MAVDNISKFYDAFNAKYDNFQTEDEFRDFLKNANRENIDNLYNAFNEAYDNFGSADDMISYLGWSAPSNPTAEAGREEQPKRQLDPQAVAEGRAMFDADRASRHPVSTIEQAPTATREYMERSQAEKAAEETKRLEDAYQSERQTLVDNVNSAVEQYQPVIDEYDALWNEYQKDTDNDLSGPEVEAKKKWLDENNEAYRNAKSAIDEAKGRLNYFDMPTDIENIQEKRAEMRKHKDPQQIIARGITPFGRDNTGKPSKEAKEYAEYNAADDLYSMAEQTLKQGSKYDPGYDGGWADQIWTAARQFGEGAANNIDKGSLTFGLSEGNALMTARKVGEKYNKIVDDTIKKLGYTDEQVSGILDSIKNGGEGAEQYLAIMSAIDDAVDGGLSDGEKSILDALEEFTSAKMKRAEDVSVASAAGAGAEQSAEFMLDFILTGGLGASGSKAAAKLASTRLMKRLGEKVGKAASTVLSDAGVAAARTAIMFPRNIQAYGENLVQMNGGIDEFGRYQFDRSRSNALLNTALSQYIEYWTEDFGKYLSAGEQALFRKATKAAPRTAIGKTLTNYRGSIGKYLDYGKFDGMFNEMMEEVAGSALTTLNGFLSHDRVGDKNAMKDFVSGEQLATLALSFLPMSAISASTNLRAYNRMKERYNDGVKMMNGFIEKGAIDQKELNDLVSDIENKTPVEIKNKIVEIADKARKANGGTLPNDFAKNLMGYVEGSFSMELNHQAWEGSQEKVAVVNAFTEQYQAPDIRNAYDLAQIENEAHAMAVAAGFDETFLENDAYLLAREAQNDRETEPERAQVLLGYATAKAANAGLRAGYDKETQRIYADYEKAVFDNIAIGRNVNRAQLSTPIGDIGVFVVSPDTRVNADGTISTPTGADGRVMYREYEDGPIQTEKASKFSGAFSEDVNTLLDKKADDLEQYRNDDFELAKNTISPNGMSRALANLQGSQVFIHGSGAFEPVRVERMTDNGASVVISGDKEALKGVALAVGINSPGGQMLELPVEQLYPLLATNDDGTLATDQPEAVETEAPSTPSTEQEGGQQEAITYNGRPVKVDSMDSENGWVYYTYLDDKDGMQMVADLEDFKQQTGYDPAGSVKEVRPVSQETVEPEASAETETPVTETNAIPVDEKTGEPIYDAGGVTPEMAYDDIYGKLKEKNADAFVVEQSDLANKNLRKAKKLVAEGDSEKEEIDNWEKKPGEGISAFLKRQEDAKAKIDERIGEAEKNLPELERKVAFWNELREVAEENIAAREAEAKRQETIAKYGVDTSTFDLNPQTMEEAVAEYLGNGESLISLEDARRELFGKKGRVPVELFRHLGNGGIISSEGGRSIQDVANDIVGEYESMNLDQDDVRNTIIDYLSNYTKSQMRDLIFNNRLQAAIAEKEAQEAPAEELATSPEVEEDMPAAEEEAIPAEEAVEEAPEGTEVPEVEEPESEPAETEAASETGSVPTTGTPTALLSPADIVEIYNGREATKEADKGKAGRKEIINALHEANPAIVQFRNEQDQINAIEDVVNLARQYPDLAISKIILDKIGAEVAEENEPTASETPGNSVPSQEEGETKPSTGAEYGSQNKVVSKDRYEELRRKMLEKIKGQANVGFDPEIFAMGVEMAAYHIEAGARKFVDFAQRMINDLTDAIRPYLKGIYNGARDLPGMEDYKAEMDSADYVDGIDVNQDFNAINDEESSNSLRETSGRDSTSVPDSDRGGVEGEEGGANVPTDTGTTGEDSEGSGNGELAGDDSRGREEGGPEQPGGNPEGEVEASTEGNERNRGRKNGGARGGNGNGGRTDGRGRGRRSPGDTEPNSGVDEQEVPETEAPEEVVDLDKATDDAKAVKEKSIKDETDTDKLEAERQSIKDKLSEIEDSEDAAEDKAKLLGEYDAIIQRLRDLYAEAPGKLESLTQEKVPYVSVSDPTGEHSIGSVVPSGIADAMQSAMSRIEKEIGKPLAEFVREELQYKSLDEMFTRDGKDTGLAGEQVDATALAIYQMKKGRSFINGDMTGIGKGRVGAALIRWAKLNGKKCIFATDKPGLFSDMYRDLTDIGSGYTDAKHPGLLPFILNDKDPGNKNRSVVVLDAEKNEKVVTPSRTVKKELFQTDGSTLPTVKRRGPKDGPQTNGSQYDFVMMTYSQAQAARGTFAKEKLEWLKSYAKDAIIICDESHLAAGDSSRGNYFQDMVKDCAGVTFMSATFAKNPECMKLYSLRSSMGDARMSNQALIETVKNYGIPMKEFMAQTLIASGEMVRRERDFTGVETTWYDPKEIYSEQEYKQCQETNDKTVGVIRDIISFQRNFIEPIIGEMNQQFSAQNAMAEDAGEGWFYSYTNTSYASQVSNVCNLMFYAMKAKKAADVAIEKMKKGEKAIIVVDNTLEDYIKNMPDVIDSPDFSAVFEKAAKNVLKYRYNKKWKKLDVEESEEKGVPVWVEDEDLAEVIEYDSIRDQFKETQEIAYQELLQRIKDYASDGSLTRLTISPIDYIKELISEAGYNCGEITGREVQIVKNDYGRYEKKSRPNERKDTEFRFNGGTVKNPVPKEEQYDAIILNSAGATGISLHASARFGNQAKRNMIIVQAAKDPNVEVQTRGRNDRTGQVLRGAYYYITSPIPAEYKTTMMLRKKLSSLDAQTSGTADVSSNKVDADDMDNKYGDEVAKDFLSEHPEINRQLDRPISAKKDNKTGEMVWQGRPGLLYDLLIGMQRMTCEEQALILKGLQEQYIELVEYYEQNGTNELSTAVLNLDANTIDKGVFVHGKDNESISGFAHDTNLERIEANVLKKPMTSKEVNEAMRKLGVFNEEGKINPYYGDAISKNVAHSVKDRKEALKAEHEQELKDLLETLKGAIPQGDMTDSEYQETLLKSEEAVEMRERHLTEERQRGETLDLQSARVDIATNNLKPGALYMIPLIDGNPKDVPFGAGRFIGFKNAKDWNPKSIKATFATKDSRSSIDIPVVKMKETIVEIVQRTNNSGDLYETALNNVGGSQWDTSITDEDRREARDEWWDKRVPKNKGRSIRYIITGNLFQAGFNLGSQQKKDKNGRTNENKKEPVRGKMCLFTRKDPETGRVTIEQGMLLVDSFDPETFYVADIVIKDDVWETGSSIFDPKSSINIFRSGNNLVVQFYKRKNEKMQKHPVLKDETIQSLMNEEKLNRTKDYFECTIPEGKVEEALNYLYKEYGFTRDRLFIMPDSTERVDAIIPDSRPYDEIINELSPKFPYIDYSREAENELIKLIARHKADIENEDIINQIRDLVAYRQALYRKEYQREDTGRLAWKALEMEENFEVYKEDKALRDKAFARLEAIKAEMAARNGGKIAHGTLKHYKQGRHTLKEIEGIFNEFNKDKFNKEMFAKVARVFRAIKEANVPIVFNEKIDSGVGGYSQGQLVEYNWKFFNSDWILDQMKANTVLHELVHTLTVYAKYLVDRGYDYVLGDDMKETVNELGMIFRAIRNNEAFVHDTYQDYGTKDWYEMLSETASNPQFREDLQKVKVIKSVRDGDVTFSSVMPGQDLTGKKVLNAYDAVVERLNDLIDNFSEQAMIEAFRGSGYGEMRYLGLGDSEVKRTKTPAFKAWFGDWENDPANASKVVNENGEPMVMYHGTPKGGFTSFDTFGSNFGLFGTGSYFTNTRSVADGYANRGNSDSSKVYSVYLNVRNPLDMNAEADVAAWKSAGLRSGIPASYFDNCKTNENCFRALKRYCDDNGMNGSAGRFKSEAGEFISDFIEHSLGYDGLTHGGGSIVGSQPHRVFIVFRPGQIKSATDNVGNYNPENADIRYREADTESKRRIVDAEIMATNKVLDAMSDELGITINRVSRSEMPKGHETNKGFYDTETGEMTICMDNVSDERDAIATVFHETVGHHGLRKLFGPRFNEAMVRIYAALDAKGRAWVNSYIRRHDLQPGNDGIIIGMEEYMSHLAESGEFKKSAWDKIKEIFGKIVDKLFGTDGFTFTDNELNYILRASYEHLMNPNWLNTVSGKAKDILMKRALGINETDPHRPTDPEGPETGRRYRDGDTGIAKEDYNSELSLDRTRILTENQNADLPVKVGMDKVMQETGKSELSEDEDYLTRHNIASSRAETEAHNFELFYFTPLFDQVRDIQSKLLGDKRGGKQERQDAYERVLDYMYAVSGLERNQYKNDEIEQEKQDALEEARNNGATKDKLYAIENRYDERKKDWSGLTSLMGVNRSLWQLAEAKAQQMVDEFKNEVGEDMLNDLWDKVRACTDYSLEHAYKYGLLTREEFEKLHGTASQPRMWEYYLPLRGFDETTAEEQFSYSNFVNPSRNSVVVKKMNGRWTQADNPLANILNIAETEIVQGQDNWTKQALYRFVLNAGENSLLTASEPWYVKNPATGKWELAYPDPGQSLEDFEKNMRETRDNEIANKQQPTVKKGRRGLQLDNIMANKAHRNEHAIHLKVGGMDKMIWVNGNPALARAVSGIGRAQNLKWLRRASRALSNLFTTYSLDFTAKNLIRDTIYSRVALIVKEDGAYRSQFRKNWRKNIGYGAFAYPMVRLARDWDNGNLQRIPEDERTEREQMFIDFMTDGGQTGYTIINTVGQIKKDLERQMRRAGGRTGTIPILGHYAKFVKTLNEAFELLTRFTAYETSRQMGRSGQRAASDAKEISVNFNRRGAQSGEGIWGNIAAYLGASHYFYNAGVQGFDNFLKLYKQSPIKMSVATGTLVLMGILTPMINSMLAGAFGGDDDDWYWNLPEWVRRNNIIIGTGSAYLAIPLPVEFRAIYGIGDITASAFVYEKTPNRTFGSLAGDYISTASGILPVNPVEGYTGNGNIGDAALRAVVPDAGMFFVDWATNRDYTGRPLWKDNPFSDNVPKSQGAYASTPKGIVYACQKLAELSSGKIDVPPGLIRDFANNYGGGFFRAAEDASKIFTGLIGDDPERPARWDNVPFFSGFTGHIDKDRSNSFASNALYEYKRLSDGVVKSLNAILNTDEVSAAIAYDEPESLYDMTESVITKAKIKNILSSKDYQLGKMYREGMNNEYEMKQYLTGAKAGQWHKSRDVKRDGVDTLKKKWKELRDQWVAMPNKTQEEKDAKDLFSETVQGAWHRYYDAQADLAERLMDYEYNRVK